MVNDPTRLARRWWDALDEPDRDRVLASRGGFLAGDLAESMAAAGIPVVGDGPCVGVGPAGFRVPAPVEAILPDGAADAGSGHGG